MYTLNGEASMDTTNWDTNDLFPWFLFLQTQVENSNTKAANSYPKEEAAL